MKNLDHLFRIILLSLLFVGLVVATWHLSWLHKQAGAHEYRYEAVAAGYGVFVLDRQQGVLYAGEAAGGGESIVWHVSPLPK